MIGEQRRQQNCGRVDVDPPQFRNLGSGRVDAHRGMFEHSGLDEVPGLVGRIGTEDTQFLSLIHI